MADYVFLSRRSKWPFFHALCLAIGRRLEGSDGKRRAGQFFLIAVAAGLPLWPFWPKDVVLENGMRTQSAKDAKYNFGRLIDMARAEPVVIEKHGRPVVVVIAVEEYERLKGLPFAVSERNMQGQDESDR